KDPTLEKGIGSTPIDSANLAIGGTSSRDSLTPNGDLKPLPESLARLDDTMGLSPPSLFCETCSATVPCQCNACSESLERMELDDIDLDSFAWSCKLSSDAVDVRLPLPACDLPFGAFEASGEGGDVGGVSTWNGRKTSEKRGCGRASRLNGLGFHEIKNYFDMPITKAAKAMNVGLTVLKKRCRELGIARWPHRKMKSLKSLIRNVQEMGKGSYEEGVRKELETLEEHRRLMEENPQIQLTERTKKLRQACFKANYKRRRLLHHNPTPACS
ncbi:hypothetical protein BHE74_00049223, partial [Ensete ventricosum]